MWNLEKDRMDPCTWRRVTTRATAWRVHNPQLDPRHLMESLRGRADGMEQEMRTSDHKERDKG